MPTMTQPSRLGETRTLLAAIPTDAPLSARELAEKVGMSPSVVGSLLRNAQAHDLIRKAGQRTEHRADRWVVVPLWQRGSLPDLECEANGKRDVGLTPEDYEWMRYWRARRVSRQRRRQAA